MNRQYTKQTGSRQCTQTTINDCMEPLEEKTIAKKEKPSDEYRQLEEEGQGEQPKNGAHPVQGTQPTCSKLYCSRMTIAFESGKWKKQCEHCISLSRTRNSNHIATNCATNLANHSSLVAHTYYTHSTLIVHAQYTHNSLIVHS
jgi:hypothetical protein